MKIKICGLTRGEDLAYAALAGADAVGVVNVRSSKRHVSLKEAKGLFLLAPPFVSKVLVCSPKDLKEAKEMIETGADYLQLHVECSNELIKEISENLSVGLIRQIPVNGEETVNLAIECSEYVDAIVLDTETSSGLGGTGKTHDWSISAKIVKETKKPVILAGGLNPENVNDAIAKVKPYAVDVASGVESSPGIKDKEKIREFIRKVKQQ